MVQCKKCGCVGARDFLTRILLEVDESFRSDADRGHGPSGKVLYFGKPVCAAMAWNLGSEADGDGATDTLQILDRERKCDSFVTWQPGSSPREHVEMRLIEEQRAFQKSLLEEQSVRDRKRRQEDLASAEKRHKEAMKVQLSSRLINTAFGVILGILATLALNYLTSGPSQSANESSPASATD